MTQNCYDWTLIKFSSWGCGSPNSILVVAQILEAFKGFLSIVGHSTKKGCNGCTKSTVEKIFSGTSWSMNHSIMVIISLDNSFYVFCNGSSALADKWSLKVFLFLVFFIY